MTMVKLNDNITELEGTEGGTVFRKDTCGQHAQSLPRITHSRSPKQIRQQKAFSQAVSYCIRIALTEENTKKWWIYCKNHPKTSKKGETVYLTPFLACVKFNTIRARNELELTPLPPD